MSGHESRRGGTGIGALTRRDHYREKTLRRKIDLAYRTMSTTSSARQRRRHLRSAHRHERALIAQRRRPQSALTGLATVLVGIFVAIVWSGAGSTAMLIVGALLLIDLQVIRRRKRRLRVT
jgi:Flp pilus assembly protein TadB